MHRPSIEVKRPSSLIAAAKDLQSYVSEIVDNVRKPNSKKISPATPERTMRRAKQKLKEHLALFASKDEVECLIAALYVGAAEDVLLLSRDQTLKLHKVEGFSINQLNALKSILGDCMEGSSVMLEKWRSVKASLKQKLEIKGIKNGWRADVSKAVEYILGVLRIKLGTENLEAWQQVQEHLRTHKALFKFSADGRVSKGRSTVLETITPLNLGLTSIQSCFSCLPVALYGGKVSEDKNWEKYDILMQNMVSCVNCLVPIFICTF